MTNSRKQMICLDILRIFACLSVVAVHAAITFEIPGRIGRLMEAGSSGLGIFYILSGFLIFISLENRTGSLVNWYKKRMLRILPLYYFMVIFYMVFYGLIVRSVPADPNGLKWASYFLCLNKIVRVGENFWFNIGALSSMSVFIWFYLLAPAIKKLVSNWNRALIFLAASYLVLRVLNYLQAAKGWTWFDMLKSYYYIAVGIVIFYAIKEGKQKQTMVIFLTLMALLILASSEGGLLYALCIGLIIMVTHDIDIAGERMVKIVSFISKRTFSIYLGHTAVMQTADYLGVKNGIKGVALALVITVVFVTILYEVVERGSVKLFAKLLPDRA